VKQWSGELEKKMKHAGESLQRVEREAGKGKENGARRAGGKLFSTGIRKQGVTRRRGGDNEKKNDSDKQRRLEVGHAIFPGGRRVLSGDRGGKLQRGVEKKEGNINPRGFLRGDGRETLSCGAAGGSLRVRAMQKKRHEKRVIGKIE